MAGFDNDTMYASNVDFSGGNPVTGKVTTNGQILVGSTIAPNIKVGTITSPDGSITVGYSDPNITLVASSNKPDLWVTSIAGVSNITGDGTVANIVFDTIQYDTSSSYNTSNGFFTVPKNGTYLVNVSLMLNGVGAAHTECQFQMYFQGVLLSERLNPFAIVSSTGFVSLSLSYQYRLTAGDIVLPQLRVSNGAKTVGFFGQSAQNLFSNMEITLIN